MNLDVPVFQEDKYKINERLGKDGMFSTVYKGTRIDGQPVIIKVFNEGYDIQYIEEEIIAIHDLRSVFVNEELDFGQMIVDDKERIVLILEPADNNLNFFKNDLNYDQIKSIFRQLIEGLKFIHNHNYVHNDIKGDNILIKDPQDSHPEAFYGDLGMAKKRSNYPEEEFKELLIKDKLDLLYTLSNLLLYRLTGDSLINTWYIITEIANHSISFRLPDELKPLMFFIFNIVTKTKGNPSYDQIEEALTKF